MKLIPDDLAAIMLQNGARNGPGNPDFENGSTQDFRPVVKLFTPWAGATWLLSELNPEEPDIAFGLCDLGMGEPELGYVSLAEILSVSGPGGIKIERDLYFVADKTLTEYAEIARSHGRIVT